jgi:Collagen triple helix repeat (20 copies)
MGSWMRRAVGRAVSWCVWLVVAATSTFSFATHATLVADAHVNRALPAVNSGAISNLNVGGGYTTLVQFDLSELPSGTTASQVSRALLRLYCNRADTPGAVSVQPVNVAWGEYSVTYATLPSLGGAAQVVQVSQPGAYVTVDVTSLVQGWVTSPTSNHGLALTAGIAVLQFDSKENDLTGHAPELDVTLVAQGPVGPQGPAGAPGATGLAGPQGIRGPLGPAGPAGPAGAAGAAGAQGVAGSPGLVFQGAYASTTNYALGDVVLWEGGSWVSLVAGNRGNAPDVSPSFWGTLTQQGPQGLQGPQGAPGATGAQGPSGLVGPAGATGPQGPQGATGQAGAQGLTGQQGPQGVQGPQGIQGLVGAQGPAVANYTGNYSSTTNYGLHDAVSYGGSTYISLVAGNLGQTPDVSPSFWAVLAAQGPAGPAGATGATGPQGPAGPAGAIGATGPQGPPASFKGTWLVGQSYLAGDAVGFGGESYIALVANVGREPDTSPSFWAVLAAAGAAGAPGATGPQGPAGAAGVNWRGAWSSANGYLANDGVFFGGSSYLAVATSLGSEPDVSPTKWTLLAEAGVAGPSGPSGAAATVTVGTVTTGAAGTQATVTNSGTENAAVLNFTIPQGAAGTTGGGGGGSGTSGIPFVSMYHAVSFSTLFYSVNNPNASLTETGAVLTWVPAGCTATKLAVFSQQSNSVTVTLRAGRAGSIVNTELSCMAASSGTCTSTGSVTVPAGGLMDVTITGASGTAAGVWTAVACD